MKVLVAYASEHGSTGEVAAYIGEILQKQGHETTIADAYSIENVAAYEAFVIGSAIHSGEWLPEARDFVDTFAGDMNGKPVFVWVSCIRVLEDKGYDWVLSNYLPSWLLEKVSLVDVTAFAGKLLLEDISYDEEWTLAIRYDGSHSPTEFNGDFRDWPTIQAWALEIAERINTPVV